MDFRFSADQIALRDAVRKLLLIEAAPEVLREIWETPDGRSQALRRRFAEQGLTALSVSQEYGGLGLGEVDWSLIHHELGYFAIPDSLGDSAHLGAGLLADLPDDAPLRREWLPRIAEGSARIAIGHALNPFVADAHLADLLLLAHADEVHALSRDAVALTPQPSLDRSRRLYSLAWSPSATTRVAEAAQGERIWARTAARGALAAAGQLVGLAQRTLDLGVDYAAQRKQFGKAIGSFQAVKHHLADVAVKIEFARPVLHHAAWTLQHDDRNAVAAVSHAKLAAGEAALLAARKSLQVHGAIGYTWEADLQMYMKRAWALEATWGSRAWHKQRVAARAFADADAGLI
ncbi:MAG: acyl-CoA dehydrogenase family protein [Rudaea sp.]|uniref:acyl-CoA dehydrogenase family protein n=1 Tax=Rudaea sp. TaxID=2136325 RepID=UPI0039E23A37